MQLFKYNYLSVKSKILHLGTSYLHQSKFIIECVIIIFASLNISNKIIASALICECNNTLKSEVKLHILRLQNVHYLCI